MTEIWRRTAWVLRLGLMARYQLLFYVLFGRRWRIAARCGEV